jgi:hypothetical protein
MRFSICSDAMKVKLTPELCYLAGLQSRSNSERNAIGISTNNKKLEEHFIDIALNSLGIEPNHLLIEKTDGRYRAFFYHSKLGGQLHKISESCSILFRFPNANSRSYMAGILDMAGRVSGKSLYIDGITVQEALMLQHFGVHMSGNRIKDISRLIALANGFSIMAGSIEAALQYKAQKQQQVSKP